MNAQETAQGFETSKPTQVTYFLQQDHTSEISQTVLSTETLCDFYHSPFSLSFLDLLWLIQI